MAIFYRTVNLAPKFGKCKRCKARIRWAMNSETGHWMPLVGDAVPLRVDVDPVSARKYPVFGWEAIHKCRPKVVANIAGSK